MPKSWILYLMKLNYYFLIKTIQKNANKEAKLKLRPNVIDIL